MIGVVDAGGGTRGIYGAAVYDWCMDNGIKFDYLFGSSAGAGNVANYVSGERGRSYRYYMVHLHDKRYGGVLNLIRTGSAINFDYVYKTLYCAGGEDPFDYEAFAAAPEKVCIVVTDALTGKPVYFYKDSFRQDHYGVISASCNLPWVNKAYEYEGHMYFDGGMSDPVPVQKAFDEGCEKVIVILTRPRDYYRSDKRDKKLAFFVRKYPKTAEALSNRAHVYNRELDLAKEYEKEGRVLILAPDNIDGMDTLTRDRSKQEILYQKGYKDAEAIRGFLNGTYSESEK